MRRLAIIPLVLLFACWDFTLLSTDGGYVPPDLTPPPDLYCAKVPNNLLEDCTQNLDINNNCLYGCDDPTCFDHVACFQKKGYMTYGGVNINQCTGTTKNIYQNLTTPNNCNGSCSCNNGNATCVGDVHVYANMADCGNAANQTSMVAVQTGAGKCTAVTGAMGSYYSIDTLTAGGSCMPSASTMLNPTWGTSNVLCDQSASMLVRFSAMATNGVQCIVFSGVDTSVCAGTKPYTKPTVYYTGTTGSSTCTCACGNPAGGCALGNGAVELDDQSKCTGAQNLTEITKAGAAGCVQAVDNKMNPVTAAALSTKLAAPTCQASGSVASSYMASGPITLCCM